MSERERFEAIVSSSPYEKSIRRWPDDATKHAWPGSYRDLDVDFAWLVLQDFLARSGQAASGAQENARSDVQNGVGVGQPEAPTAAPLEPFRAALAELVELENLRIRAGTISPAEPGCEKDVLMDEWRRRIRSAWSNARAALTAHPPARSGAGSEEGGAT